MIIGLDGSYAILRNNTTEGNYSKIVIDAIAENYPKNKLYVYTPLIDKLSIATSLSIHGNVNIKVPRRTLSKTWWMSWGGVLDDMKRHHVNIYHGVAGQLPYRINHARFARVVTIHGLGFKRYASDYGYWDRARRSFVTFQACKKANRIIATSEHSRDDLMQLLGVPSEKISVVYPALDKRFYEPKIEAELDTVRTKYKLPSRYILVVSSLVEHKNVLAVLRAMKQMQGNKDVELVIVGQDTSYYNQVIRAYAKDNKMMHRVLHIMRAHAIDMPSIFRLAEVLVAPSRLEGFGLAVIEAQSCGVPVIISQGTALEEAAGDAALRFGPDDASELASALEQVLDNATLRDELISAGNKNIERFTPKILADNLIEVYHQVLNKD